jgi:hypothetical protein
LGEFVTTATGPGRELDEEGGKKVAEFLLINVSEVEIKVGQRGLPSIAQGCDILYDRGTEMMVSV